MFETGKPAKSARSAGSVLMHLWNVYMPYWPAYVIVCFLFLFGAWFYLSLKPSFYEATASILIKDEKKGAEDSRMAESLNMLSSKKIVENEIEILTSRSLMNSVATKLHLYAPISIKQKLGKPSAYSMSPIMIEVKDPAKIKPVNDVEFEYDYNSKKVSIGEQKYNTGEWVTTPYGTLKFVTVEDAVPGDERFIFSLMHPKSAAAGLLTRFTVEPSTKMSTVLELTLREQDPVLSEKVLNAIITAYSEAATDDRKNLSTNTLSFVQDRLSVVEKSLDSIERKVQQYKSRKQAVDISSQGRLYLENVSANDQELGKMNMQAATLDQIEDYVQSKDRTGSIVPSTLDINDPLLGTLLTKLYDAELEQERLKKTTGANSPLMAGLNDQISKLKPSILDNIRSQKKSLEARRSNLSATNSSYESYLKSIPEMEKDLVEISREQNIANNIYAFLLQKREEAALSNNSNTTENRVVDWAEASTDPVSPKRMIIYAIFVLFGLFISVGYVAAKQLFRENIMDSVQLEELTASPVLAEIPFEKAKSKKPLNKLDYTLSTEQFKKLRTSLVAIGLTQEKKRLMITSSIPNEGKSFVTANLGLALAVSGKRTVIIEADMSNPAVSDMLDSASPKTLKAYLDGKAKIEEIIVETKVHPNLFLISAGVETMQSAEMLMVPRMEELLNYLEKKYDKVLIDTAPVGARSDAYVLSPLADSTLYVVRYSHTPKRIIEKLDKSNRTHRMKNVGIVLNGVPSRSIIRDSYGYGYEYTSKYQPKMELTNPE